MTQKVSQCNVCKELIVESGNYSFTILRARKVPKKANKLSADASVSAWGMSKFQKYLASRSVPKNVCEIKCGNCSTTCRIPMTKNKTRTTQKKDSSFSASQLNLSLDTSLGTLSNSSAKKKKKKKNKGNKDANAGLIIPESFRPSDSRTSTPLINRSSSALGRNDNSPGSSSNPSSRHNSSKKALEMSKSAKLLATKNALQRALFNDSKSAASSGNSSPLEKLLGS